MEQREQKLGGAMLVGEAPGSDYLSLMREFESIDESQSKRTVRLALLGDFATQQLTRILRVLGSRNQFKFEIYEAGYDAIELEAFNPASDLYAFRPEFVAILLAPQKQIGKIYASDDLDNFSEGATNKLLNIWGAIKSNSSATIIQSNFVMPSERAFGNYELSVAESLGAIVAEMNHRLVEEIRKTKGVLLFDIDYLAAEIGRRNWFDERMWSMAKAVCSLQHLPQLGKALLDVILAAQGKVVKCVILDLDNTLWGGVIGDDGVAGIALGGFDEGESFVAFQKFILSLKRRGIILAVVSKNDHANAVIPFRSHPDMVLNEKDISVFVANWDNKVDNIKLVQKTLNIGFDSMVFVDDNPFERNIVRQYLPDVIVPEMPEDPSLYIRALVDLNLFETTTFSNLDKQRGDQYREQAQRELAKTSFTNVQDYLASLQMKIRLERFNDFNIPRIAQLIQRSNQFNLTTRRYSERMCEQLMRDPTCVGITLSLSDKFGDHGLISVIIIKIIDDSLFIDEYLMSCRVLQRGVEDYAMNRIFEFAESKGLTRVVGTYVRTTKNDMVKDFYKNFGFSKTHGDDDNSVWELVLQNYEPRVVMMKCEIDEL